MTSKTGAREDDIHRLERDLSDERDTITRRHARERLTGMGLRALPYLSECLRDRDHGVRWEAAKILQSLKDPAAAPPLTEALRDDDFDVRWVAAGGLIALGRRMVVPLLQSLLRNPGSPSLRLGAHHVLRELNRKGLLDAPLRRVMMELERMDGGAIVPAADQALKTLKRERTPS